MRKAILILGIIGAATIVAPAMADVPPPNSEGCLNKVAGDACQKDDLSAGSCEKQTCTKLDYSMGTPPTTVQYECVLCTGPANSSSSSGGGAGGAGGGAGGQTDDVNYPLERASCAVQQPSAIGAAGALGAWIFGAAMLMFARRNRPRHRS